MVWKEMEGRREIGGDSLLSLKESKLNNPTVGFGHKLRDFLFQKYN